MRSPAPAGDGLARPLGHDAIVGHLERLASRAADVREAGVPHAVLMTGPAGVGKYRTALWWASLLQCEARPAGACEPACASCLQLAAGSHPDLTVIEPTEPGKAIAIAEVRSLIRTMSLKPQRPGPRVAIVRDAHELGVHAQSAMLKLLEEPPGAAVIILVTENLAGLLATIRSRCQAFRFGPLGEAAIVRILQSRGHDVEFAHRAAALARGSAGRALACTAESLEERDRLLLDFEQLRAGGDGSFDRLVATVVERQKQGRGALDVMFEWTMTKIEAALGRPGAGGSSALADVLTSVTDDDLPVLLKEAERICWTMGALERNANARLAVRDLLLDVRP